MSIIRKYNPNSGKWETVAASNASAISVRSEQLLEPNEKESNVEKVLQNLKKDITTLKGNVSWLAAHGGGGSGGGSGSGGGGSTPNSDAIIVNSQPTNSQLILEEDLEIEVQSNDPNNNYQIAVSINNKTLFVVKDNRLTITKKMLQDKGINKSFRLSISAFNVKTLQNCFWNGTITIPNISLSIPQNSYAFQFDNQEKDSVPLVASVEILGYYTLKVNNKDVKNLEFKDKDLKINVSVTELKELLQLGVGSTDLNFQLVSNQNDQQKSQVVKTVLVLTANEPIISSSTLSTNPQNPTPVNIDFGNDIVLPVPFTPYYNKGAYKYIVSRNPNVSVSDFNSVTTFYQFNQVNANASIPIDIREADQDATIYVHIYTNNNIYSQPFYIRTSSPEYDLRPLPPSSLFNFQSYAMRLNDNNLVNQNNFKLQMHDKSSKSGIDYSVGSNRALRMQSYTYCTLKAPTPFQEQLTNFTLSISYRCDFHPDDNRTILLLGKINSTSPSLLSGIRIQAHKLEVANSSLTLLDQELMTIDITYQQLNTSQSGRVFIYINGVIEAAYDNIQFDTLIPREVNTIYLGAQPTSGLNPEPIFHSDFDLYRVSLYNRCLDPMEILNQRLNDLSYTHLTSKGKPDDSYIKNGLKRNFISKTEGNEKSLLWDNTSSVQFNNNNEDFLNCFNLTHFINSNGGLVADIGNYNLPIPILYLDVSGDGTWTWNNFISPNPSMNEVEASFYYADNKATHADNKLITGKVNVKLQGTSTLSDIIKNLKITFKDDVLFSPKETWFPEQEYTLKADIVDSSHSLNASIGKFVNEKFGLSYKSNGQVNNTSSWYPFSEQVTKSYSEAKKNENTIISKLFPKATLKHGIEGFPIFLLIRFRNENNTSESIVKSLGIYQFLLGRNSPRNFGFEIINGISVKNGNNTQQYVEDLKKNLQYPLYLTGVSLPTAKNNGYWIEANQNDPFPDDLKFTETTPSNLVDKKLTGLFWQPLSNDTREYYDNILDIKYSNVSQDKVSNPSEFKPLRDFIDNIITLPISIKLQSGTNGLEYYPVSGNYNKYKASRVNNKLQWTKDASYNISENNTDGVEAAVNELDLNSYSKYFVIAMFFGLIDNFAKNMPLKFIQRPNGTWEPPLLGIYDMDTGLGGDNQGSLNVSTDVWLQKLVNLNGSVQEIDNSSQSSDFIKSVTGQNNKLWYFDNNQIWQKAGYHLFVKAWKGFLQQVSGKDSSLTQKDLIAIVDDYFYNYFLPQTDGCGELLFNLTYFAKYINTYNNSNQLSKLHGRRHQQVYAWLKNRIMFLDSLFNAIDTSQNSEQTVVPAHSPEKLSISSGSGRAFHLRTNYPVITEISHQGSSKGFYLLDNTKDHEVYWGSDSQKSSQVIHDISYPQALNILGTTGELNTVNFQKINNGKAVNITRYDLNNCQNLASSTNVIQSFVEVINGKNVSELREIDLSNTRVSDSDSNFSLNLTGADKLAKLNLRNSAVTNITFPENPPQYKQLIIEGSKLRTFNLSNQNLLTELSFKGCTLLTELQLINCNSIQSFTLQDLTNLDSLFLNLDSLRTLEISNCPLRSLEQIPTIYSSNLEELTISNCKASTLVLNTDRLKKLSIYHCPNLKRIILNSKSLEDLNVHNSPISYIGSDINAQATTKLSLQDFEKLKTIALYNTSNEYIQLPTSKVIEVTREFYNTKLKRVYGKIRVESFSRGNQIVGVFQGCSNFRPYGNQQSQVEENVDIPLEQTAIFYKESGLAYRMYESTDSKLNDVIVTFKYGANLKNVKNMFAHTALGIQPNDCKWLPSNLFSGSPKIVVMDGLFGGVQRGDKWKSDYSYEANNNNIILASPTIDSDGNVSENNGFFSHTLNLSTLSSMFDRWNIISDRYLFRLKGQNFTAIKSFDWFNITYIVNDYRTVNSLKDCENIFNSPEKESKLGNLTNFFLNMPNLDRVAFTLNLAFLNFDTTVTLASKAKIYYNTLTFNQSTGTINLDNLFLTNTEVIPVEELISTLRQHYDGSSATLKLTDTLFSKFKNLRSLGVYGPSINTANSHTTSPFYKINKVFDDFPKKILDPVKNSIEKCDGLFAGINKDGSAITGNYVNLPGDIFKGCSKLKSISGCFANFPFKVKLTGFGFSDCTQLQDVSYLFTGIKTDIDTIPFGLLFHGFRTTVKRRKGITQTVSDNPTYSNNEINGIPVTDIVTSIKVPNTNIINAMGMLQYNNIDPYVYNGQDISMLKEYIENVEYDPVTYYINDGIVTKNAYHNVQQYDYKWIFDGVNTIEGYDGTDIDESSRDSRSDQIYYTGDKYITATNQYMCAPDLLRYCSNNSNTNIQNLFNGCGNASNSNSTITWISPSTEKYGIKGRIPPHLISTLKSVTNISGMFANCHLISAQKVNTVYYTIPKGFFRESKVNNLTSTFRGMSHVQGFSLDAIKDLRGSLILDFTFAFNKYPTDGAITIKDLFTNPDINISSADSTFSLDDGERSPHIITNYTFEVANFQKQQYYQNQTPVIRRVYRGIASVNGNDRTTLSTGENFGI